MMTKVILLVIAGIILLSIIIYLLHRAASRVIIFPVLTVEPLFITPSIEPMIIDLSKESLFVREGLDFIKVSKQTLLDSDVLFFRTYSPNKPDAHRKLVVAERIKPRSDINYDISAGVTLIYKSNDTYYVARCVDDFYSRPYDRSKIRLVADDNKSAFTNRYGLVAVVKTVYGDYRVQKTDSD